MSDENVQPVGARGPQALLESFLFVYSATVELNELQLSSLMPDFIVLELNKPEWSCLTLSSATHKTWSGPGGAMALAGPECVSSLLERERENFLEI